MSKSFIKTIIYFCDEKLSHVLQWEIIQWEIIQWEIIQWEIIQWEISYNFE